MTGETLVFENARLVMPYRIIENGYVAVKDGRIADLGQGRCAVNGRRIDCAGALLSAGFIELHIHGSDGFDFSDGTEEAYLHCADFLARQGVTTVYPTLTTGPMPVMEKAMEAYRGADEKNTGGARFGGLHLEGPYFSYEKRGAQDPRYIHSPFPEEYVPILDRFPYIKRWSVAPELDGAIELGRELRRRGIVAAMAHTDGLYEELMPAYENGYTHMTHFYSAMSTIRRINAYRHSGAVELGYAVDEISIEIIADGKHLPPEILRQIFKTKNHEKISLITDAIRGAGMPEGSVVSLGNGEDGVKTIIEDGVAKLADRSAFAGSVATAPRLLRVVTRSAGLELCDAVKMITANPSRVMGTENERGSLTIGKAADLTVFDDDFDIKMTVRDGRVIYSK